MQRSSALIALLAGLTGQVQASSFTLGTLLDTDEAVSWQASGTLTPGQNWLLGGGAGTHDLQFEGDRYSGTSLAAATRVNIKSFFAGASAQRWRDSGELTSLALQGELGWTSQAGLSVSVLFSDRSLRAPFATLDLLGQTLSH